MRSNIHNCKKINVFKKIGKISRSRPYDSSSISLHVLLDRMFENYI